MIRYVIIFFMLSPWFMGSRRSIDSNHLIFISAKFFKYYRKITIIILLEISVAFNLLFFNIGNQGRIVSGYKHYISGSSLSFANCSKEVGVCDSGVLGDVYGPFLLASV